MYSVMYRNIENSDADIANAAIDAPAHAGLRSSVRSNIGRAWRRSTTTNPQSSTTAPTRNETISGLPQPSALPRTRANTSRNRPPENVTSPAQSTPAASGSRDSSTRMSDTTIAPIPIGTLMRKIDSHPTDSVSTPPTSGPMATAAPVVAPHTPNAVPRSRPWNVAASSASDVANIAAAPTPCRARASSRNSGELASAQSSDAAVKSPRPAVNSSRRPNRSASDPAVSSSAASDSA